MEDKTILDTQLSASSFNNGFLGDYVAQNARLNGASYWATAEQNAPNPWIQVDFLTSADVKIYGIQTQGGTLTTAPYNTEWVTALQIQTGDSIDLLEYIMDGNESMVRSRFCISLTWLRALLISAVVDTTFVDIYVDTNEYPNMSI